MSKRQHDGEFQGFVRCLNQTCAEFDQDRPIQLKAEGKKIYGEDAFARMVLSEMFYVSPLDDADTICPECHKPGKVLEEKPPVYEPLAPR